MVDTVVITKPVATGEPTGHTEAMIAKVDGAVPAVATTPSTETERPSWLPEKFKTVEDMATAYAALEAKQSGKPDAAPVTPPVTPDPANPAVPDPAATPDAAKAELEAKGLNLTDFSKEFNDTGTLSAESYDKLLKAGYDKNLVDTYIAGQQALATQFETSVFTEAGGKDAYVEMVTWAKVNMTAAEQDAYNAAVSSGNLAQAQLAVAGLKSKFTAENGSEPNLLGGKVTGASEDVFESYAQLTEAMKDPRYAKDSAYRNKVQQKLARSNI